jgi:GT2 family glycosyltransferase
MDAAVILMVYRSRHVLGEFLTGVGKRIPIILVDNSCREDDLSDVIAGYPNVTHLDAGGNIGFSAAANRGARAATAPYLVFMNPDTQPTEEALRRLVDYLADHPEVGACGAAGIGTAGGGAQPSARRILAHTLGWHKRSPLSGIYYEDVAAETVAVEWIAGSCLAIRADVYAEVGGFDPEYFIYMSDFDLGLRLARAGYRQVILGDVVVPHEDGGSSDLPSPWTWERRGRAWARYLRRTRPLPAALGMSFLLFTGYAGRSVIYAVTGRRHKASEVFVYARSLLHEWLRPTKAALNL